MSSPWLESISDTGKISVSSCLSTSSRIHQTRLPQIKVKSVCYLFLIREQPLRWQQTFPPPKKKTQGLLYMKTSQNILLNTRFCGGLLLVSHTVQNMKIFKQKPQDIRMSPCSYLQAPCTTRPAFHCSYTLPALSVSSKPRQACLTAPFLGQTSNILHNFQKQYKYSVSSTEC